MQVLFCQNNSCLQIRFDVLKYYHHFTKKSPQEAFYVSVKRSYKSIRI